MTVAGAPSTPPPDGGWGWVVMAATFLNNFLTSALWKGTGVMYVALTTQLPITLTQAALIISMSIGISCVLGPVSSSLSSRYTHRVLVFSGGLTAAVGFGLAAVFTSLLGLIMCFSIISGIGVGLLLLPNIIIVHQYFDRRRACASGFSLAGGSIGGFAMPPLLDWVYSNYGLTETLLTLSAIFLHVCPLALLLRPVSMTRKKSTKAEQKQEVHGVKYAANDEVIAVPNSNGFEQDSLLKVKCRNSEGEINTSKKSAAFLQWFLKVTTVDPTIFKEKYFYLVTFSSVAFIYSWVGFLTIFPDFVTKESAEPVSLMNAVLLLSIMAIGDVVFRIAGGWLMDLKWVNRRYAYTSFLLGGTILMVGYYLFPQSYAQLVVSSVFLGVFVSGLVILPPVILSDSLGPKRFPMAYSLHASVVGCVVFFAAPSLAYIREVTGSYRPCILLMAVCYSCASLCWIVDSVCVGWKGKGRPDPSDTGHGG